ncbi:MAG: DEAD/DEAH box helicase [Clostridiales bacterium]|nr:DEAD/DEAH box helicase [Clostridiales bacterium]
MLKDDLEHKAITENDSWRDDKKVKWDQERWDNYQRPVMVKILEEGSNTLGLLPTGMGKSSLYRYFAAHNKKDGIVIVIEPLMAIIKDQIQSFNLCYEKSKACSVNDFINRFSIKYSIVYVSPEELFENSLKILKIAQEKEVKIQMIVIDEAHTMFDWGSTFRREYMFIPTFIDMVRNTNEKLRILSLTATLTNVQLDLYKLLLGIEDKDVIRIDNKTKRGSIVERYNSKSQDLLNKLLFDFTRQRISIFFFNEYKDINRFKSMIVNAGERINANSDPEKSEDNRLKLKQIVIDDQHGEYYGSRNAKIDKSILMNGSYARINVDATVYEERTGSIEEENKTIYMLTFRGDLESRDKEKILEILKNPESKARVSTNLRETKVLATKALAMGVDISSIQEVVMVGMPESWNYYLQEAGRIRSNNAFGINCRCLYSRDGSLKMLNQFLKQAADQEKINENYVTVVNRIKLWDYLSLWEWIIKSDEERNTQSEPDNTISLKELLDLDAKTIEDKLDKILISDSSKSDAEDLSINKTKSMIRVLFNDQIKINMRSIFIKGMTMPWIVVNNSQELYSYCSDTSIFNTTGKKYYDNVVINGISYRIEMPDGRLNFFDFVVFNALYTCTVNHISDDQAIISTVTRLLLGLNSNLPSKNEKLDNWIKESIKKISAAYIYNDYETDEYGNIRQIRLYDHDMESHIDTSFPLFDEFEWMRERVFYMDLSYISLAYKLISKDRVNHSYGNILSTHYTLFGLERARFIPNTVERKQEGKSANSRLKITTYKIPYETSGVLYALKDSFGSTNIPRDKSFLRGKMKRILVGIYNYERNEVKGRRFLNDNLKDLGLTLKALQNYPADEIISQIYDKTVEGGYGLLKKSVDKKRLEKANNNINHDKPDNLIVNMCLLKKVQKIRKISSKD